MLKSFLMRVSSGQNTFHLTHFRQQRGMHSRNKKASELIAKGWSALKEVDRVIDYSEPNDKRLIPLLRVSDFYYNKPYDSKENFELALEVDNSNTHARYWLSRLHLKYDVPGKCKAIGAALLQEAADMGNPDALYELGCQLRIENDDVQADQQAFHYLGKAVDQLHPNALYLLGAVYLTGDCVKKDTASALWCFHRASERGHAGAAIAYGSLLLRGPMRGLLTRELGKILAAENLESVAENRKYNYYMFEACCCFSGVQVPESLTKFSAKSGSSTRASKKNASNPMRNPIEMAKEQFEIAAKAGSDLGFRWLKRLEEEEKHLLAT